MSTAIRGERESAPEGKVWMGSEEACGEGNRKRKRGKKKQKTENMRKIEKRKKEKKTILFNLKVILLNIVQQQKSCKKVQQQIFNFYLTISSSILYICNRTSKFYK